MEVSSNSINKISVIIPLFNCENYLAECLDSVINQSLKNIEIICVDDCSTDNSQEILNSYAQKDSRIKVIHLEQNQGQGYARNIGIDNSTGEYIGFVDSDDYVDSYYFEKLYNSVQNKGFDIAVASVLKHKIHYKKYNVQYKKEEIAQNIQDKIKLCSDKTNRFFYCFNKIYKSDLIKNNNIRFSEGQIYEDVMFAIKALYNSNKVVSVPDTIYHYVEHKSSTVKNNDNKEKKINDYIKSYTELQQYCKEKNINLPEKLNYYVSSWTNLFIKTYIGHYRIKKMIFGVITLPANILEYSKDNNTRIIKLLNIEIYYNFQTYKYCVQKFLKNLIITTKKQDNYRYHKEFYFLGLKISDKIFDGNFVNYYIFHKLVLKKDIIKDFYNKHLKNLSNNYDDIYVLLSNSGETNLFIKYILPQISNNPLFIILKDYHKDILKLYGWKNNIIKLHKKSFKNIRFKKCWKINNNKIYPIFPDYYYEELEKNYKNTDYFSYLLNYFRISREYLQKSETKIPDFFKNNVEDKIKKLKLNSENFVILSPEANTCIQLSNDFWIELANNLQSQNYDIYFNITNKKNKKLYKDFKFTELNYPQILYLGQKSKGVISLRSGLTEFLLSANVPNISIYTLFRTGRFELKDIKSQIRKYSMYNLPFINKQNVKEFNYHNCKDEEVLIDEILKSLKNMTNNREEVL